MSRYQTPNDILWAYVDPEADRLLAEALARTPKEVEQRLRARGHDLRALDQVFMKMMEALPSQIGRKAMADALVPPRPKPPCLVSSGSSEADAVLALVRPDQWATWPGDESMVGIVVTVDEIAFLEWFARETIKRDLRGIEDPRAVVDMDDAPVPGKVTLLLGGKDAILRVEVDVESIRAMDLLTTSRILPDIGPSRPR